MMNKMKDFDVASGKIANDNTNATILVYMGSEDADNYCISLYLARILS